MQQCQNIYRQLEAVRSYTSYQNRLRIIAKSVTVASSIKWRSMVLL
ncbi:MAG: hypothetical protein AB4038_11460 [Prochloraceae cyanobacterium]